MGLILYEINNYRGVGTMEGALNSPKKSLTDLLGNSYIDAVYGAFSFLKGKKKEKSKEGFYSYADEKVDFYPLEMQQKVNSLIPYIGTKVCDGLVGSLEGAGTEAFTNSTKKIMSPLAGYGFFRIGEDGKLYLISKSEHYHASLGHSFPGYRLIENAKRLGIDNITHNNTRGFITRLLEEKLVALVNGIDWNNKTALSKVIKSEAPHTLNRVINLETGSLAVEAAVKMMLARFYRLADDCDRTKYKGKVPVFLVMADNNGGRQANYHGTTIITQLMRGLWPGLLDKMETGDVLKVCSVRINDIDHFKSMVAKYDSGKYKIAGFLHELILMNYGGIKLEEDYIQKVYAICRDHDIPILVDEIQSCIWSPELFTFREYGLSPDFVSVGKGFPGGQYPASRIITTADMDNLNQFGALVTNGQEELSSLAYLITIEFAYANREHTREVGDYYSQKLKDLVSLYPKHLEKIEGMRHLSSLFFYSVDDTVKFVNYLNEWGIDISAHTYKPNCPPAALTKLPLTSSKKAVDFVIDKMKKALDEL